MTVMHSRAHQVLQRMAALPEGDDDAEILCEGLVCYLGHDRIHRSTVNELLRATAIRPAYDDAPYFVITETGQSIARRPELADDVFYQIMRGRGAFSVINDHLVRI